MPPEPAVGRLVGHVTGSAPGGWIKRLALEPAAQVDPRAVHSLRAGMYAARKRPLHAFGSHGVVRNDEAGGPQRSLGLPKQTLVESLVDSLELDGGVVVDRDRGSDRLDDGEVHLSEKEVGKDHRVRRPPAPQLSRPLPSAG